jgi:hypothetical protein
VLGQEKKREQLKQEGKFKANFGKPAEAILGPYWSAKKGHFRTAASREEQIKFRPSFLSQRRLFAGRTSTNKQVVQQAESVQVHGLYLGRTDRPYWPEFVGSYSQQLGDFLLRNVNIFAGKFVRVFSLLYCCNYSPECPIKSPLSWFSPHWGFQGTSGVVLFLCFVLCMLLLSFLWFITQL